MKKNKTTEGGEETMTKENGHQPSSTVKEAGTVMDNDNNESFTGSNESVHRLISNNNNDISTTTTRQVIAQWSQQESSEVHQNSSNRSSTSSWPWLVCVCVCLLDYLYRLIFLFFS